MQLAYLFSGQGSQFVGMGKDLYDKHQFVRDIYEKANSGIEFSISDISFNGPEEKLNKTEFTQVAIVTLQIAILKLLEKAGFKSSQTAGLSLGEYTALYNSNFLSLEEVSQLVLARGQIMMEAAKSITKPKMAVVLGLEKTIVDSICKKILESGLEIGVSNYNCPGQQVVGGTEESIKSFELLAMEFGAKRVMPLDVSVPSHTSLMQEAVEPFKKHLDKVLWKDLNQNFYSNTTGNKSVSKEVVKNLVNQLTHSTHMETIITNMIQDGVDTFVEIGPKKVIAPFIQKIAKALEKEVTILNVSDQPTLESTIEVLKGK